MSITFALRPGSIRSTSNPPTWEAEYVCAGVFDASVVKASALNLTPQVVAVTEGILFRHDVQVVEAGHALYYVTVHYDQRKSELGQYRFNFTSTGGTVHITHSRETIAKYPPTAPNHQQAMALDKENRPQGTDMVIPALKLTYTFKHPLGIVNEQFARSIGRITGCCNEDTWHGFAPGEALLLGADGSDGTDSESEVAYHVVAEENLQGLVIGGITDIAKDGHDFLWVWWKDFEDAGQQSVEPRAVYVERLYRRINFAAALGF